MGVRMLFTAVAAVAVAGVGAARGPAVMAQTAPAARLVEPLILSSAAYTTSQGSRLVTVWRRDVEWSATQVLRYLDRHRDRNAAPNVVLYAVDSPAGAVSEGRVVWIAYDFASANAAPVPVWGADATVDPATKNLSIVVFKSFLFDVTLSLHQVTPASQVAAYPLNLTADAVENWPKAAEPVSTFKTEMRNAQACRVSAVDVTATFTGLFAVGVPDRAGCPSLYLDYNSTAKTWREVTVTPAPGR